MTNLHWTAKLTSGAETLPRRHICYTSYTHRTSVFQRTWFGVFIFIAVSLARIPSRERYLNMATLEGTRYVPTYFLISKTYHSSCLRTWLHLLFDINPSFGSKTAVQGTNYTRVELSEPSAEIINSPHEKAEESRRRSPLRRPRQDF